MTTSHQAEAEKLLNNMSGYGTSGDQSASIATATKAQAHATLALAEETRSLKEQQEINNLLILTQATSQSEASIKFAVVKIIVGLGLDKTPNADPDAKAEFEALKAEVGL